MSIKVKIKKRNEQAVIPTYAKPGDAGMDLTAIDYEYDIEKDCHIYKTGLSIEIPEGYVGLVFPRSSNRKTEAYMCNHVGVIDSGYRGDITVSFKLRDINKRHMFARPITSQQNNVNIYKRTRLTTFAEMNKPYQIGDRVAQLMIIPYPTVEFEEVTELSKTERGEEGHGSTGK